MNERDIFLAAIAIADAKMRSAYVEQACGGDAALQAQVVELLRTHQAASQFLETPAVASDSVVAKTIIAASSGNDDDSYADNSSGEAEIRKYLEPTTRPGWLGRLGHYEIEEILGRGAFGIVAKAFDEKLHRVVAIKLMNPDLASTSPPRKRFLREARTAAAVTHENIVAIHAVEEAPIPYLVMEYIPGETLQQRLDQHGPLELSEVLRIGQQVAFGLAAAHAVNLIHRDIKPSNILLGGPNDRAKISDFGLARAVDDATLTSSGLIAGTPMYMAPEQARGETLDHRADLFSLGSVLYQMISGRPPFRAANTVAVLKRVCEDTPRPMDDVIPGVPAWLSTIVFRLLEKERDDRYQTAQEVADLLARCQSELQHGQVTCVEGRSRATETAEFKPARDRQTTSRKSLTGWLAGGLISAAVVIGLLVMNYGQPASDPGVTNAPGTGMSQPNIETPAEATGWHGWPADAPKPAIAPFDAAQAKKHQEEWAAYLKLPVVYTNSLGMKFVLIPPGEFMMGSTAAEIDEALNDVDPSHNRWLECIKSEAPRHKVILSRAMYLGANEVTQKEYEAVMKATPSHFASTGPGKEAVANLDTENHPVESVSWNDAAEFCAKLSEKEDLKPFYFRAGETITPLEGTGYRLPTEAEWEFACRAGTTSRFWIGDQDDDLVGVGWFRENSGGRTHAAGELKANPLGLSDIHGNIWEWVDDAWDPLFYGQAAGNPAVNPSRPFSTDSLRVLRGGRTDHFASYCRSAHRHATVPMHRSFLIGFRASLAADGVRQALKVDGPKTVKSSIPAGAMLNPIAEQGRSAWDDLDASQIPAAERVPGQPAELVAVLGEHRQRHWGQVNDAAIRPDGKQAATCGEDGIRFWDLQTFQEQAWLNARHTVGLPQFPISLLYTPDGRSLLVGHGLSEASGSTISELDVTVIPPRFVRGFKLPKNELQNTWISEISSSGKYLSIRLGNHQGYVVERTESELKLVVAFPDVWRLSFAPDEKTVSVASRDGGPVRLFVFKGDKLTEKAVLSGSANEPDQPQAPFREAQFSPDGRLLVIDGKFMPWMWDVSGADSSPVTKLTRDGLIPSFSGDGETLVLRHPAHGFRVWSMKKQAETLRNSFDERFPRNWIELPNSNNTATAVSPDGRLAVLGLLNGTIRFLDISAPEIVELNPVRPNPSIRVRYAMPLRLGTDALTIMTEIDGVGVWSVREGRLQPIPVSDAADRFSRPMCASEDGSLLVTLDGPQHRCTLRQRNGDEWRPIRSIPWNGNAISAALSRDQRRLVIGSDDGRIEAFDLESKPPRKLWSTRNKDNQQSIRLFFARNDQIVVSEVAGSVITHEFIDSALGSPQVVRAAQNLLTVSPDGESLAIIANNEASIWSLKFAPPQQVLRFRRPMLYPVEID